MSSNDEGLVAGMIAMAADAVAADEAKDAPPAWPRVVNLQHPIERGKERITSLEFRRGRFGDLKGMKLGETVPASDLALVASRLCGQPVDVIEKLDADDAGEVMGIALDFFAKCLSTGKSR